MSTRTQAQRSRDTRARLMQATVDCLVEHGWSGTTTTVVARRAGVSRGAQLHHYPTRAELVTAAVEHLAAARVAAIREAQALAPGADTGPDRVRHVLDLLAGLYTGPVFQAALELWVAARTDDELRAVVAPLEARFGREAHRLAVDLLGVDDSRPEVRASVQATLDLLRGLGLADVLTDDTARRTRLLAVWADTLHATIAEGATR